MQKEERVVACVQGKKKEQRQTEHSSTHLVTVSLDLHATGNADKGLPWSCGLE